MPGEGGGTGPPGPPVSLLVFLTGLIVNPMEITI